MCIYGTVGVTGPVEIYGSVGVTGIQLNITAIGVTGTVGITGPVTVTGAVGVTGTVGITGPVTVTGAVGVTGTVGITGPVSVTGAVDITSASNSDAFGRLRVSNPYTLFEFNSILGKQPAIIDEAITNGGTSTWVTNESYINMSVSANGDSVIRQSHEYILYQPGKSKLVYMTGVLYSDTGPTATNNITTRIGCYDDDFGFYIQMRNNEISINRINSVLDSIPRSLWDDSLDGSGPSGETVDFSKAQIFWFDFEWLGVGQVRCGVVVRGVHIPYYTFTHVNELVQPYIPMAKLPLRYEIISTGSANSMRMICGTVISEGGFSPIGRTYTHGNYTTAVTIDDGSPSTYTPISAIRVRGDFPFNRTTVKLKNIDIFNNTANTSGSWKLLLNPSYNPASIGWTGYNSTTSAVEISTTVPGVDGVTGGTILYSGFYSTRENSVINTTTDELVAAPAITVGLTGTSDVAVLVANAYTTGTDPKLYTSLTWIELI